MRWLDWLLGRKRPPGDVPLAGMIERNQKVLEDAEAELQRHSKVMAALMLHAYAEADRALAAARRGAVARR